MVKTLTCRVSETSKPCPIFEAVNNVVEVERGRGLTGISPSTNRCMRPCKACKQTTLWYLSILIHYSRGELQV